jgi:hypothetical protein
MTVLAVRSFGVLILETAALSGVPVVVGDATSIKMERVDAETVIATVAN